MDRVLAEVRKAATYDAGGILRWTLTRQWSTGPTVVYIGHNPSTANHETDDPTSLVWTHFARAQGFGRYVAVNLYPYRSSNPRPCRRWALFEQNGPDWYARDAIISNLQVVVQECKKADRVVACWGAIAEDQNWVEMVIEEIQTGVAPHPDLYCLGKTGSGAPIHPMARGRQRIPRDAKFEVWKSANTG